MKKKVLALFMAVSLASASLPMTVLATETSNVSQQEELGIAEDSETTEETELTEADNERESEEETESTKAQKTAEATETQKKAEATETIEQQGTVEVTETTEQPETEKETEAFKEQDKSEALEVETEEADKQRISIEEVLKNRAGGLASVQGTALSQAQVGQLKQVNRGGGFIHMVLPYILQSGISIPPIIFTTI